MASTLHLFTTFVATSLVILWDTRQVEAISPPLLAEGNRTYQVINDNQVCLFASFEMTFYLYHVNNTDQSVLSVPEVDDVMVGGSCGDIQYQLTINWTINSNHYGTTLKFERYVNSNWTLKQILLTFEEKILDNLDSYNNQSSDMRTFTTNPNTNLFNRTFNTNQYFYCKGCKMLYFSNQDGGCNSSDTCSYVTLDNTVIYLGNFEDNPEKQICIEDWIAFREMIIPIAVGSCLGLLLLIVLNLYIIVFIKRKVSERRGIRPHYKKIENK